MTEMLDLCISFSNQPDANCVSFSMVFVKLAFMPVASKQPVRNRVLQFVIIQYLLDMKRKKNIIKGHHMAFSPLLSKFVFFFFI